MLTNTLPFHDSDPMQVLKMHLSDPVPPLPEHVPDTVANLVLGCLKKNPDLRPQSAMALLEAAKVWLTSLEPSLDLTADPILKNTLIDSGPPGAALVAHASPSPSVSSNSAPSRASSVNKTMLSASGQQRRASAAHIDSSVQRPLPGLSSSGSTLVHASPVPPSRESRPRVDGVSDNADLKGLKGQPQVPSQSPLGALPVPDSPKRANAPTPTPAPFSDAPVGTDAPVRSPQPPTPIAARPAAPAANPAGAAIATYPTPQPIAQQASLGAFLLACFMVAITFGLGGYYITWALR